MAVYQFIQPEELVLFFSSILDTLQGPSETTAFNFTSNHQPELIRSDWTSLWCPLWVALLLAAALPKITGSAVRPLPYFTRATSDRSGHTPSSHTPLPPQPPSTMLRLCLVLARPVPWGGCTGTPYKYYINTKCHPPTPCPWCLGASGWKSKG